MNDSRRRFSGSVTPGEDRRLGKVGGWRSRWRDLVEKATHFIESQLQRSKPRLLIVTDDVADCGTAQVAYQLAFSLRANFDIHFACQRNIITAGQLEKMQRQGISVHSYGVTEADAWHKPWQSVYDLREEIDLLRASRPDIILTVDAAELISFSALKSVAKRCSIPFVTVINVLLDEKKERFGDLFNLRISLLAGAEALVFACDAHLHRFDSMLPNFGVPKLVILNSRPDAFFEARNFEARSRLRSDFAVDEQTILCLTAARIEPHKGQIRVLKALSRLNNEGRGGGIRIIFAGTGRADHVDELQKEIVEYGMAHQVSMLGWRTDVCDLLDASDVFILPSKSEATSLSIIEAMARGLPVVATGVDGILELIDETCGILLPLDEDASIRAIAAAIDRLKNEQSLRLRLGEAGRKKADQFRVQSAAVHYKDILVNALCERPRSAQKKIPARPIVPVGSVLDFADPAQVWNFLKSGWSFGEAEGVWTIGSVSTLVLQTSARQHQMLRIIAELAPYLGPTCPSQETDVFVDGQLVASWNVTLPARQALSFIVKVSDKAGKLKIRLVHHRAVSPLSLGLTQDSRELGLFFYRINILSA